MTSPRSSPSSAAPAAPEPADVALTLKQAVLLELAEAYPRALGRGCLASVLTADPVDATCGPDFRNELDLAVAELEAVGVVATCGGTDRLSEEAYATLAVSGFAA